MAESCLPLRTSKTHGRVPIPEVSVINYLVTITHVGTSRKSLFGVINFLLNKKFKKLFNYKINQKLRKYRYLHKFKSFLIKLRKYREKRRNKKVPTTQRKTIIFPGFYLHNISRVLSTYRCVSVCTQLGSHYIGILCQIFSI